MIKSNRLSAHSSEIDILLIGHITRDVIDASLETDYRQLAYRLGGTVSFAAVTALRLGRSPTIVTSALTDVDLDELPKEVEYYVLPASDTTTFANIYTEEGRVQYCYAQAAQITAQDIPTDFHQPQAVLLGPLVNEIEADVAALFAGKALSVAGPQGWMRRWDKTGRVYSKPWVNATDILPYLNVLTLSLEDIDYDLTRLEQFFTYVPLVVVTEYRDGSTLYRRQPTGEVIEIKIPPRPANEVDPTGAGDVFATAFMIRLQETDDPVEAARFANVTASFAVEHLGVSGIPSRETVLAYMEEVPFHPNL